MKASGNATIRHLFERTVMYVDTKDLPFANHDKWKTSSGTLVSIGNYLFVATVSHSLDHFEKPTRFRLMTPDGRNYEQSANVFIRTIASDFDRPDVGLMELDAKLFRQFSTNTPIELSRISIDSPEEKLSSLMGTPFSTVNFSQNNEDEWGVSATVSGFTTVAIKLDDWPKLNLETPFDADIEMLINYPSDSPDIRDEDGNQTKLEIPRGISGGGLWTHGHTESDELWTPDACKLAGIQASWISQKGFVRLPRIIHWLRLVHENYPDLRQIIEGRFPSLTRVR